MELSEIRAKNPHISIHSVYDEAFFSYGNVIKGYDFTEALAVLDRREIPAEGNIYVAKDDEMMTLPIAGALSEGFYGRMPIQIGYCNGNSNKLNALEYHKGNEIDAAGTELVLLLSHTYLIKEGRLDVSAVEGFYLPAGCAVELYSTTLHFAPCRLSDEGFCSLIVLPDGTNSALDGFPEPQRFEDKMLWMQNKWLIAHPESIPAGKGAYVGITGENIGIAY